MKITSSAFEHQKEIPSSYTCDGQDINPPLTISDVPSEAKDLVLIVNDPDAPNKTWVHWTVWNINPDQKKIIEDSVPKEAQEGVTDFGNSGYGGPCPPSGEHRYFFKLYALDEKLDLPPRSDINQLEEAMTGHVLEKAALIGIYSR